MRKGLYLMFDGAMLCIALVMALYIRHGFPLIQEGQPGDLRILLLTTFLTAIPIFMMLGIHTRMWRHTSYDDITMLILALTLAILVANTSLFLVNRLEAVPRSVPPLQWAISVCLLAGGRLVIRSLLGPLKRVEVSAGKQHVIIIGVGQVAELYVQFIRLIARNNLVIEGVVDGDASLTNRAFQKYKVLGTPQDLQHIIEQYYVHGIEISQLILTVPRDTLSADALSVLQRLEDEGTVKVVAFHAQIGAAGSVAKEAGELLEKFPEKRDFFPVTGIYPYIKRMSDILGALILGLILMPFFIMTSLLVAVDVGLPILFWQQRPGMHGKPFRLYKFRTMRPARRRREEDRLAHKAGDSQRTSVVGKWIRRLRLDELPQLYHILMGQMSFIGPRPLLWDDQPKDGLMRLSVRPGISGWAQVNGGDALLPEEKLILDLWYIENMSLWLDMRISLRTLVVIFQEDTPRPEMVLLARDELQQFSGHTQDIQERTMSA